MTSEVTFSDVGGYRVLLKASGSILTEVFSVDMRFRYYDSETGIKTFPASGTSGVDGNGSNVENNTGYSRIILFSMSGGNGNNNKGITLLLEKYDYGSGNKVYVTAIYNKGSGWGQYLPGLNNGDGIEGIDGLVAGNYYHITFNYMQDSGDSTNGFYELNLLNSDGSVKKTRTSTSTAIYNIAFANQSGIGTPNENVAATQTMFPGWDYTPSGGSKIFAYSIRNLTISFIRLWDGNIRNSSTTYTPDNLYNNSLLVVTNPTSYPQNLGTSSTKTNSDYQRLMFQLDPSEATSTSEFYNTAYIDTNNPDGDPATLTNSPTGYSPLSDFGVNSTSNLVLVGTTDNDGNVTIPGANGDPHLYTLDGYYFDFPKEETTFILFSNQDNVIVKAKCLSVYPELYMHKISHMREIGYNDRANKYYNILKDGVFIRYIQVTCCQEQIILDMESLRLCNFSCHDDLEDSCLPLCDTYESNEFINVTKIFHSKLGIVRVDKPTKTTLQRNIRVSNGSMTVILKCLRDRRNHVNRNAIYPIIKNMEKDCIGSFLTPLVYYSSF